MAKQSFGLFDPPPQTNSSQSNQDKLIVLDPTELYDIPRDYIPITTDVEWIRFFGVSSSPCWIQGERLCKWAEAWLRAWNKMDTNIEIKQDPSLKLAALFAPLPLPQEWTDKKQLLNLATRLESYPQDNPIAYLLADITDSDRLLWQSQEPSIQHLAAWLAIQVPQECKPLEQVWQYQFQEGELVNYYQTEDKLLLLRRWLGIAQPILTNLGEYELPVPDFLTEEFDKFWSEQIYRSEGKVLDQVIPYKVAGMERIANCAYNVFTNRPTWMTKDRKTKVAVFLTHLQKQELSDRQSIPEPQPLDLNASPNESLTWVTENYLPFRRWEIINQISSEQRKSERLANSFVDWMLLHYPEMKVDSVENSFLNYSVASKVGNLCQRGPVLWVVVDGLGWLDHIELLTLLTKNNQLAVETDMAPRFSILPTKTEYAKWSLYTQLLPSDSSWVADAGKAFSKMGMGKRYTDRRIAELRQDLGEGKLNLYCWDTEQFDKLHHTERDWQHLYKVKRPNTLEGIAREIQSFVEEYPNPELLRVAIASDHGQIMGTSQQITHCPPEIEPQGRIAIGKTDDPQFVVLERSRYGLPHDISIVRSSASLGSFSYTDKKKIIGSHGGLFPEEVVVGVSVLRKSIQRVPVIIFCRGEGEPRQSGEIEITIDNPNLVSLTNLCLYIQELPSFCFGKPLERQIPANQQVRFKLTIPEVPELPPDEGDRLLLSGKLTFQFANAEVGSTNLAPDSTITINDIFRSGFNIDEFM
ncbi:MAG: hypothetical protein PUP91_37755 [Rhizonema sp. PD37]|nr:hypothetical protein [Rhizonema sp. PD37]